MEEEEKVAVSFAKKADIAEALARCHEIEYEWHKKKVIAEMLAHQEVTNNENNEKRRNRIAGCHPYPMLTFA